LKLKYMDPKNDNFFKYLDSIEDKSKNVSCQNYELMLIDPYVIHRSQPSKYEEPIKRTFFRMTFSVREFDRLGNTKNQHFDYNWKMEKRNFAEHLSKL